ncbi:hypothetical protein PspLS_10431 [Pyricularia sp. CBS 133598]|nr:hypothetical protein PspLS_10431 [Pyricularia sp. CBS 133598]
MLTTNPVLIQNHPRSRNEPAPLFLIHDASGLLTAYFHLGTLGRKVYGIFDPKFDTEGLGGWQSIEEIAEAYVRLIRRVVTRGDIILGVAVLSKSTNPTIFTGWSFGGILSVQIAHILATKGSGLRVSRIVLIDSVYPRCDRHETAKRPQHEEEETLDIKGVSNETREKLESALMRATCLSDCWEPPVWAPVTNGIPRPARRGEKPAPPPTVLIRAQQFVPTKTGAVCPLDRTRCLPQLGWEDMQEGFVREVIHVPAHHYNIFDAEVLKSLDPELPSSEIITRAALLQTVFTLAQCVSSMILAKVADSPRGGRKLVLAVGTLASTISCLAFGFITSFGQAVALRILEGAFNGNVATVRTMMSEVVKDKCYQPRAFVMLPLMFNFAAICSPLIGGQLVNLATRFPNALGHNQFLLAWPYALPALVTGFLGLIAFLLVLFFLEETLEPLAGRHDPFLEFSQKLFSNSKRSSDYSKVDNDDEEMTSFLGHNSNNITFDEESSHSSPSRNIKVQINDKKKLRVVQVLPFLRIFTLNLIFVLIAATLQESHVAGYNTLWTSFLSDPVLSPEGFRPPFRFGGGAGMAPVSIGWTQAMFGIMGLPMLMFVFVRVQAALGTVRMWRTFLLGFPLAYFLIPYLVLLPSSQPPPQAREGPVVWVFIVFVQTIMVITSTFVVPAQLVLINLSSPHPSALGRTHSIFFVVTSLARAISSAVSGVAYGWGSSRNFTGFAWWVMSALAGLGFTVSWWAEEGTGHEIKLDGEDEQKL